MKISTVMHPAQWVSHGETIAAAAARMRDQDIGSLLIIAEGQPAGIVTDRDITVRCSALGHHPEQCHVWEHMSSPLVSVSPDIDLLDAVQVIMRHRTKRLAVFEGEKLVGLVSLSDIARAMELPMQQILTTLGATRRGQPLAQRQ